MATFARFHTPSYPTPVQGTEQEALGFHFIREDEDQLARPESKGHTSLMIWGFFIQQITQWEFQDPKMEVLYHIRPYFGGIFPYMGLT